MSRTPRRRRAQNLSGMRAKLGVNERDLDRKRFAYRWVNEENLASRTEADDWDKMAKPGIESTDLAGSTVSRVVGKHEDGSPKRAYLCQKPRKLYDEDRAAMKRGIDETMTAIRGGRMGVGADQVESTYIPKEGISISEG